MNTLIVLALAIAAVVAKPYPGQSVSVTQDTLGNYNLKYAIEGISRVENRDIHGNVGGGYSYIDPHGIERKIEFTSGVQGFNAIGADIPLPVQDTPEVAHAKAAHLSVLRAAELTAPSQPIEIVSPQLVKLESVPLVKSVPSLQPVEIASPQLVQLETVPLVKSVPFAVGPIASIVPAVHQPLVHLGAIPETPEVLAARAEHFAAHAAARANLLHH